MRYIVAVFIAFLLVQYFFAKSKNQLIRNIPPLLSAGIAIFAVLLYNNLIFSSDLPDPIFENRLLAVELMKLSLAGLLGCFAGRKISN